ncbi:carboxymuconolactone decarboxylase family protein [Streptomyces sp. NPDC002677]|uniref:carboxymuconolactone decarboxylase family protein n=1 Tax=Streptomyces sp. NPDC002677 TaxID=3154774 RepID=UPI003327A41F
MDARADTSESTTRDERFARGIEVMSQVDGGLRERVLESLADISPELGHQVVAWGFGEIYSRPELVPRDRQLVTLGMLTALGGCEPQLEVHINFSLNAGLTPQEIVEALLHSAGYCGFPKALNATLVAKKVFAERGLLPVGRQPTQGTTSA